MSNILNYISLNNKFFTLTTYTYDCSENDMWPEDMTIRIKVRLDIRKL